jgi:hypothetical protein
MTAAPSLFLIVGEHDTPVFELDLSGPGGKTGPAAEPANPHLSQFILHAALDSVAEALWHPQPQPMVRAFPLFFFFFFFFFHCRIVPHPSLPMYGLKRTPMRCIYVPDVYILVV